MEYALRGIERIIGYSPQILQVQDAITRVARTDAPVVISGEQGTGKSLVARAIHESSNRSGIFLPVYSEALGYNILHTIFGYKKIDPQDPTPDNAGIFEAADGGTLFFHEIGAMALTGQRALAFLLKLRVYNRIGDFGNQRHVNARVIASASPDLQTTDEQRLIYASLRDLISAVEIEIPSLRERKEDIPPLADYFVNKQFPDGHRFTFTPAAIQVLTDYDWPGNVAELKSVITKVINSYTSKQPGFYKIRAPDIKKQMPNLKAPRVFDRLDRYSGMPLDKAVKAFKLELIESEIARSDGNISKAARALEAHRNTLIIYHKKFKDRRKKPT